MRKGGVSLTLDGESSSLNWMPLLSPPRLLSEFKGDEFSVPGMACRLSSLMAALISAIWRRSLQGGERGGDRRR
jgi:hypothetical protein